MIYYTGGVRSEGVLKIIFGNETVKLTDECGWRTVEFETELQCPRCGGIRFCRSRKGHRRHDHRAKVRLRGKGLRGWLCEKVML